MELTIRAMLLLGITAMGATPAGAQQGEATPEILHFLTVPWGASAQEVETAYGTPFLDRTTPDSVRVMIYKDQALGNNVLALFYVDQAKGLVKGVYTASYGPDDDCEVIFAKFKSFVQRLYPAIQPVERRRHDDRQRAFCDAAATGQAAWNVSWTDPASGNSIRVSLEPDGQQVEVTYQSRAFSPSSAR